MRAWPDTRLTWVIGKVEASLLADIAGVEFIIYDKSRGWAANRDLRAALRGRRFDLLLNMQASLRANFASRAIRSPVRVGFDRARARDFQWLFTNRRIAAQPRQHVLDGLFGFAVAVGIDDRALAWDIPLADADRTYAAKLLPDDRPALLISPCSSQRARNFRNWSVERYAAVADHVAERYGARVVVTGGPTQLEKSYGASIRQQAHCEVTDLTACTTLKQLLALIANATAIVCPDSGPAHMATAVDTPVVGLYASSNPDRTGPYLSQQWVVNKYPEAIETEYGKTVDAVPWGQRVRRPDVMATIPVSAVTDKLDQIFAGQKV